MVICLSAGDKWNVQPVRRAGLSGSWYTSSNNGIIVGD